MVSNQKLQNALEEIRQICNMDTAMYSAEGNQAASTDGMVLTPELSHVAAEFWESMADSQVFRNYHLYRIKVEGETRYILVCQVNAEECQVYAKMAACQIRNLVMSFGEPYDRNKFIQHILMGNILMPDIYSKAKKHHIADCPRVVFVIDTGKNNNDLAMELVKNLADLRSKDFVTSLDQHSVILVKDVSHIPENALEGELKKIASSLADSLHMEVMIKVRVGYGNVAMRLADITQSYEEARMALEVGRLFYGERDTISYGKLGIGRLIYQLPMSLCEMFIKEVFGDGIPDILEDEEAMTTISKFLENNLNISETARQLYVHRNTLVYRLERIEKALGLDIRTFDDAMTFKIAIMVIAHMKDNSRTDNSLGQI